MPNVNALPIGDREGADNLPDDKLMALVEELRVILQTVGLQFLNERGLIDGSKNPADGQTVYGNALLLEAARSGVAITLVTSGPPLDVVERGLKDVFGRNFELQVNRIGDSIMRLPERQFDGMTGDQMTCAVLRSVLFDRVPVGGLN